METPFPCPFCRSTWVHLAGGGRRFLHYQCGNCSEVWTAQRAPEAGPVGKASGEIAPFPDPKSKVLLN